MIQRRGLLAGLGVLLAAPAIIRTPGLLMPVNPLSDEPQLLVASWRGVVLHMTEGGRPLHITNNRDIPIIISPHGSGLILPAGARLDYGT